MDLQTLFSEGYLRVAQQPKNNELDLAMIGEKKLVILPIDHDYPGGSAAMHNAVFDHYGLPYRSVFVVADPEHTKLLIDTFRKDDLYLGGGVGSGFKDKVGAYLDKLDTSAQTIGSVNVIQKSNGKLIGYNTDGAGFVHGLLEEHPGSIMDKKVVILGAGGTALPIAYELAQQHPKELVILNRTVEKAQRIAQLITPYARARYGGEDSIGEELKGTGLVINTTNKGAQPNERYTAFGPMTGDYERDTAKAQQNLQGLPQEAIVADILLEEKTTTLAMAERHGYRTHNGKQMNLYQAVPAIKLITGIDKPDKDLENIMREAL